MTTPGGTDCSSQSFTGADHDRRQADNSPSFTPTSGPVGASVTIIGTNFTGTTSVKFNWGFPPRRSTSSRPTQITATVPSGATTGKICVTTPGGTACSSQRFTVTSTGVPHNHLVHADLRAGRDDRHDHRDELHRSDRRDLQRGFRNHVQSRPVDQDYGDGPCWVRRPGRSEVTTPLGSATSTSNFTVSTSHSRSVTLKLKRHLVAKGVVSASDGFTACTASVPVRDPAQDQWWLEERGKHDYRCERVLQEEDQGQARQVSRQGGQGHSERWRRHLFGRDVTRSKEHLSFSSARLHR